MRIVIVGRGRVGAQLADMLVQEGHDVACEAALAQALGG